MPDTYILKDPQTGHEYEFDSPTVPTKEQVLKIFQEGRKARGLGDTAPTSDSAMSGRVPLGGGRTLSYEATLDVEDGGARDRWLRSGPKLSEGPDSYAALDLDKIGAENDAFKNGRVMKWMRSFDRLMSGAAAAPIDIPREVGQIALGAGDILFNRQYAKTDPVKLLNRGSRLLIPFFDQLKQAEKDSLVDGGQGIDLGKGAESLKGAASKLWADDPVGLLAQAAPLVGSVGGLAVRGAGRVAARGAAEAALIRGKAAGLEGSLGRGDMARISTALEDSFLDEPGAVPEYGPPAPAPPFPAPDAVSRGRGGLFEPVAAGTAKATGAIMDAAIEQGFSLSEARSASAAYGELFRSGVLNEAQERLLVGVLGARRLRAIKQDLGEVNPAAASVPEKVRLQIAASGVPVARARVAVNTWSKLLHGVPVEQIYVDDLGSLIGKEAVQDLQTAGLTAAQKIAGSRITVSDIAGIPKGFKAGFDLSPLGRQGAPLGTYVFWKNPKGYIGAWSDMFKSWLPGNYVKGPGERNYKAAKVAIEGNPNFSEARNAGLRFSGWDGNEAGFTSSLVQKVPGMGMSERAFNAGLDRLRIEAYSAMREALGPNASPKAISDIADFVNVASGWGDPMASYNAVVNGVYRGSEWVGSTGVRGSGKAERAGYTGAARLEKLRPKLERLASDGMFSARNTAARFQYLNPVRYGKMDAAARKVAIQSMAAHAGAVGVVTGLSMALGAKVAGPNPKGEGVTGDFGKIKIGDTRYEVTGGYARQIRLTLALGQTANGQGTEAEKLEKMRDLLAQFFRNSASPVAGAALDTVFPKYTPMGAPEGFTARSIDLFTPLMVKDFYDAFTQEKDGGIKGMAQVAPGVFGVGVQKYQSSIYGRGGAGGGRGGSATRRGVDRAFEGR